jgi:hypothetical protein
MKLKVFSYKKECLVTLLLLASCLPIFADVFVSLETFTRLRASAPEVSADTVYRDYSTNAVQFEMDYKDKAFVITGTIARIRRGFFDEYIVELYVHDAILDISVVYPKSISAAKKQDIAALSKGDYFEAFVAGRSSYAYVDVICYKQNGNTRTEL